MSSHRHHHHEFNCRNFIVKSPRQTYRVWHYNGIAVPRPPCTRQFWRCGAAARKRRKEVVDYLVGQDVYTLHKPTRRRFVCRRTYSKGIGDLYQIELVDLTNLSTHNDGYTGWAKKVIPLVHILHCTRGIIFCPPCRCLLDWINVFTKRSWSVPLKTDRSRNDAFERIIDDWPCTWFSRTRG